MSKPLKPQPGLIVTCPLDATRFALPNGIYGVCPTCQHQWWLMKKRPQGDLLPYALDTELIQSN